MTETTFEKNLRSRLHEELPHRAKALAGAYDQTLDYLNNNVYEEVRAAEPHLTDHGPRHVANVHRNIVALLSDDGETLSDISAVELYCLAMATLFHDVGNVHGRENHHRNIGGIFDTARGTSGPGIRREKAIVIRACGAHTGLASDGTRDTLKDVPEIEQFESQPVRLQQVAAILRFADELAEGPQRTSSYRIIRNDYPNESLVYQEYASITQVLIDRGNRRILLTYDIPVDAGEEGPEERQASLTALLSHVLRRIVKLDQERRYAVHYTSMLSPFVATEASFTFHCGEDILDYELPSIRLDDLTVPGEPTPAIEDSLSEYSPGQLAEALVALCQETKEPQ